jgi:hypothetical protein
VVAEEVPFLTENRVQTEVLAAAELDLVPQKQFREELAFQDKVLVEEMAAVESLELLVVAAADTQVLVPREVRVRVALAGAVLASHYLVRFRDLRAAVVELVIQPVDLEANPAEVEEPDVTCPLMLRPLQLAMAAGEAEEMGPMQVLQDQRALSSSRTLFCKTQLHVRARVRSLMETLKICLQD